MLQPPGNPDSIASALPATSTLYAKTVERARAGDHIAFENLFLRWSQQIWKRILRLVDGNVELAKDLHQETWLKAWKGISHMKADVPFERWLYRIAANVVIDNFREAKKIEFLPLPEEVDREESTYFVTAGPEDHVCDIDCLEQALTRLSPRLRTCLILSDYMGFSPQEIAELLDQITTGCIRKYLTLGRAQLRQAYWAVVSESDYASQNGGPGW